MTTTDQGSFSDSEQEAAAGLAIDAAPIRGSMAALSLPVLLAALGTSVANVALPTLAQTLHAPFQHVQWVVLSYLLSVTALIVSVGRLGDIVGRRRLLLAGLLLFTIASACCAFAPDLWTLVAARAVQGMGAAMMMALAMAMVGQSVPATQTGRAMGLLGSMSAVGTALGPTVGGMLIAAFGWRSIFLILLPLGMGAWAIGHRYLPEDRRSANENGTTFDWAGTMLLALTLVAYALALTTGRGAFGLQHVLLLTAAMIGFGLFILAERRATSPLVQLGYLRERGLAPGLAANTLVSTVLMATLIVGPFYLAGALGLAPARVGIVMSAGPIVAALLGAPSGRMVDRFGSRSMMRLGLGGIALGAMTLAALATMRGIVSYVGPLVVLTAGYAVFQAANNTAIMAGIGNHQRGVVSGLLNLSRNLGLITGASVMGAVFALGAGAADMTSAAPGAIARGTGITFAVGTLLIVVAVMVTQRGRGRSR